MDKLIKPNDKPLEPDLVCSKDGDTLYRSERESFRICNELLSFFIPEFLAMFGRFR